MLTGLRLPLKRESRIVTRRFVRKLEVICVYEYDLFYTVGAIIK
jgi:hypothetical protein